MTFHFKIFAVALYVAVVYATIALGAVYYRRIHDKSDLKDARLGEDLRFFYDPRIVISLAILLMLNLISLWICLVNPPNPFLYIIPLAIGINFCQFSIRLNHQRLIIQSGGIIIRRIWLGGARAIDFDKILLVEHIRDFLMVKVSIYSEETKPIATIFLFRKDSIIFLQLVRQLSGAVVTDSV